MARARAHIQVGSADWAKSCAIRPAQGISREGEGDLVVGKRLQIDPAIKSDPVLILLAPIAYGMSGEELAKSHLDRCVPDQKAPGALMVGIRASVATDKDPFGDRVEPGKDLGHVVDPGLADGQGESELPRHLPAQAGAADQVGHLKAETFQILLSDRRLRLPGPGAVEFIPVVVDPAEQLREQGLDPGEMTINFVLRLEAHLA